MKINRFLHTVLLTPLALASSVCVLNAQSTLLWDAGGGSNKNWTTNSNWNPDGSPSGNNLQFQDAAKGNSTTVGNIVSSDITVESLWYRQTVNNSATLPAFSDYSNNWQVTNINSGVTLTLNATGTPPTNILRVGRDESGPFVTNAKIQGEGSLVVDESTSNIWVNNPTNDTGKAGLAILDMSGLSSFTANVNNVEVGTRGTTNGRSIGQLSLATDNSVTANSILVGTSEGVASGLSSVVSSLQLGRTNDLNVDNIYIGAASGAVQNRMSGEMIFQTLGPGPTPEVVIRAKDGVGRANLIIGKTGASSGTTVVGTVDFTGGTVDALLNDLIIGDSITANMTGSLSMDEGTIDATTVRLGYTGTTGSAGQVTGNLNVSGGSFLAESMILAASQGTNNQPVTGNLNVSGTGSVTVSGNLTMGNWASSSYVGALTANVSISGGLLTVGGNLLEGAGGGASRIISTVTLNGGTLDMTAGNIINLTNFNLESGTLKNLAQFNAGADVSKTTGGTLIFEGTNAYTGNTTVSAGTLLINGNLTNSAVTVQSGGTLGGSGVISQSVAVQSGGNLSPGNSPGLLTTGNLSLASGADLTMELAGATPGTTYDQIQVNGTVNLNSDSGVGSDLVMTLSYAPVLSQTFTLISNDGADAIIGTFATINGESFGPGNIFDLTFNSVAYGFQLSYSGGDGNDLVATVTAIPEPGTWLLVAVGLSMVVLRRRRLA